MGVNASRHVFDRTIRPHLGDGFRLARLITKNRPDAEDVLLEASLRAFRAANQIHDSPRAWFLSIVRNTAFTWLAARRKFHLVSVESLSPAERNGVHRPFDALERTEPEDFLVRRADEIILERAIQALPEGFRQVVVLRDIQGLSYREIADIVGAPLGTVMSRLSRARRRLQRALPTDSD